MIPKWMKVTTAGEYADVTGETIRNWIRHRGLKSCNVGKTLRVNRDDLDEFMRTDGGTVTIATDLSKYVP